MGWLRGFSAKVNLQHLNIKHQKQLSMHLFYFIIHNLKILQQKSLNIPTEREPPIFFLICFSLFCPAS